MYSLFLLATVLPLSFLAAIRELRALSTKPFAIPGEAGFPLGGLFPTPATKAEAGEYDQVIGYLLAEVWLLNVRSCLCFFIIIF